MNQSETINELAAALSKAQAEIRGYKEDSSNPFFRSRYGDLTSVWAAAREPLTKNGLSVVQTLEGLAPVSVDVENKNGSTERVYLSPVCVHTTLLHESGQWIRGSITMMPDKPGPQAAGSAITYARRYSLAAIVGIAPQDDDAESATDHERQRQAPRQNPQQRADAEVKGPARISALYRRALDVGVDDELWRVWVREEGLTEDRRTHTQARLDALEERIQIYFEDVGPGATEDDVPDSIIKGGRS